MDSSFFPYVDSLAVSEKKPKNKITFYYGYKGYSGATKCSKTVEWIDTYSVPSITLATPRKMHGRESLPEGAVHGHRVGKAKD